MMLSLPLASRALSTTFFISPGDRNWPFLILTGLPLAATAWMKSVWRQRNAGVCSTSTVVATTVDVLQTPAFLCRQTDFIHAVAASGKPVNIKKGQFLSPGEMKNVVDKAREASGKDSIMVCERGASFGYNNLVSDMRSLAIMRETGCPVVFDATHSVQLPGGQGTSSGGQREFVPVLARAAVASGVAGVFMETHPDPDKALSDGPNAWP